MINLKYLNRVVLGMSVMVLLVSCGDTTEATDNKVETSEKQITKTSTIEPFIKKYAVKSANIEYKITGAMNIMGSTSETTGSKKLIFSEYGSHELTKINKVENQNMMGEKKVVKTDTLEYIKEATLYKVDFEKKSIGRMQVPGLAMMMGSGDEDMVQKGEKMMQGMGGKKVGTDKVLGYSCDVWSLMGSKQCLYKGVALKIETNVMGVKSVEVATKAKFDIDIDKSAFKLPEFPVQDMITGKTIDKSKLTIMDEKDKKDALLGSQQMSELGKAMKESQEKIKSNLNMSKDEQKRVMIEALGNSEGMKSQFQKQQEMMPKIITLMKSYKECLQGADSKSDAQSCDKKSESLAKKIGLEDEFSDEEEEDTTSWTKEGRAIIINEMEQEIKEIEKTLPCIQKAKNMMDMMNCNQR